MVFVTAANARYFPALVNLVGSIHYWAPERRIVAYDLGLESAQLEKLAQWRNVEVVRRFIPAGAPPHVGIVHNYAWKPIALSHALGRYGRILWIDAGSDLRSPPDAMLRDLEDNGHFFVQGQDLDMTLMSQDRSYEVLGATKEDFKGLGHFAASLQGYIRGGPAYYRILRPMTEYALNEQCIAPTGSDLSNHRYDQTLLSILIYQSGLDVTPHTEMVAASREELEPDPASPSAAVVYTAHGRSDEYAGNVRTADETPMHGPDRAER